MCIQPYLRYGPNSSGAENSAEEMSMMRHHSTRTPIAECFLVAGSGLIPNSYIVTCHALKMGFALGVSLCPLIAQASSSSGMSLHGLVG